MSFGKTIEDRVIENAKLKEKLEEAEKLLDDWDYKFMEICSDIQDAIDILRKCTRRKP